MEEEEEEGEEKRGVSGRAIIRDVVAENWLTVHKSRSNHFPTSIFPQGFSQPPGTHMDGGSGGGGGGGGGEEEGG